MPRETEAFAAEATWPGQAAPARVPATPVASKPSARGPRYECVRAGSDPVRPVGQLLDGQYRVDALVGEGGFSAVYRGTHMGLGEPIAIKCLKLSHGARASRCAATPPSQGPATPVMSSVVLDSFVKRFRDEGRILYKLSQGNLNVVRCIASGTTLAPATGALVPYLVLEWLEGRSLQADLEARARQRAAHARRDPVAARAGARRDRLRALDGRRAPRRSTGNIFLARSATEAYARRCSTSASRR